MKAGGGVPRVEREYGTCLPGIRNHKKAECSVMQCGNDASWLHCVRGLWYSMWSAIRERRSIADRAVKSRAAAAVVVVAMMSSSARVEAFKAAGAARSSHIARARLSPCAAAAMAEPVNKDSSGGDKAKRALNGEDSRSFFERLGSPKYIAAPMVEHSEAVSYDHDM